MTRYDFHKSNECPEKLGCQADMYESDLGDWVKWEDVQIISENLVIDLARETYDAFVMGGLEPEALHAEIKRLLSEAGVRVG